MSHLENMFDGILVYLTIATVITVADMDGIRINLVFLLLGFSTAEFIKAIVKIARYAWDVKHGKRPKDEHKD